ncbi:hypothetical protein ONS96_011497 [Cadophora gregata f. sp. sojae]|nr:hypothetical protein ONS96_011497 [Cadophora gregata f. sp. sojae]
MLATATASLLFAVNTVSGSALPAAIKPSICRKPFCTSFCPDGTPFNCCVVYVRDPCADHQVPKYPPLEKCKGPDDFECKCRCEKCPEITYLCNAQYFRDPCSQLPNEEITAEGGETSK